MLELGRCPQNIEDKWNHFWYIIFDMGWHEGLWVGIYINELKYKEWKWWIEMQRILCVCVREEKTWNIEPKDTKNIYFLIRKSKNIEPNKTNF